MNGSFVSPALRERVRDLAIPIARGLGRLGLSPNALTVIGFAGTCVAALAAANQSWLVAGLLVLAFGIFDLFDGTLARATGRTSAFGAFLDSTLDRAGEAIVYIGVTAGCLAAGFEPGALLAASAMGAAFMVSYARAKAEGLGFTSGTGMANVGLAPREVRIGILVAGLVAVGVVPAGPTIWCVIGPCPQPVAGGLPILGVSLALIALLATITTIQRILNVRAQSREG